MALTDATRLLLERYEVRKTKRQKADFRRWLCGVLDKAGYEPKVETSRHAANVVVGDPETTSVIFTAHYDTCAELPIPNLITPRNVFWYGLYQVLLVVLMIAVAASVASLLTFPFGLPRWLRIALYMAVLVIFAVLMLVGLANPHTANDNTSGVATLIETALALPPGDRDRVCLVFFDNEEKGLLGSAAFAKRHPTVRDAGLVLNFDCVSDGDSIQFFPNKVLKADAVLSEVEAAFEPRGGKDVEIVRGFGFYPSDNMSFKRAAGVCSLRRSPVFGHYMNRIHTRRDRVFDTENIELLRDGCLRLAKDTASSKST